MGSVKQSSEPKAQSSISYELARCAVCGGADAAEIAGPEDLRQETELLWQFHGRRLLPHTPPDRLIDRVAFSQPPPWRVVRCRSCGLVYRNPVEKRNVLRETYAEAVPPRGALHALHRSQSTAYRAQMHRLSRHLGTGRAAGLEVGSYVGAFLAATRSGRWRFEGLDVNPRVNAFVRSLGFVVHDGELEHYSPGRQFDAVVIWNTFDQLADPRAAARAASRLLRPDGVLAIRVPNGACYTRWRRWLNTRSSRAMAVEVLAHNNLLTFPYRFGFSPASLTRLLNDVGFHVVETVRDVLVPTTDEWTKRWARAESRLVKPLTRLWAPWFEIYARNAA